jgi:hypothetical protein
MSASSSSESSLWETWNKAVWTPYPEAKLRDKEDEYNKSKIALPFDFAARPIDPCLIPFAITTNATMVPTLVQNLREYCRSRSPGDLEADPAVRESLERAWTQLENSYARADNFTSIFRSIVTYLLSSLGIPIESFASVGSVGVQFTCSYLGQNGPDSSTYFAVDDLGYPKPDDAYYEPPNYDDIDVVDISDTLDKIHLMAESRRVFNPEDFKFTCIRKEDSLVIRVCPLRFLVLTAC